MASNPKLPVSENWRWPGDAAAARDGLLGMAPDGLPKFKAEAHITESPCDSDFTDADIRAALLAQNVQLRRDRDELLDALVKLRGYVDRLVAPIAAEEPQAVLLVADDLRQLDALLARVKGR